MEQPIPDVQDDRACDADVSDQSESSPEQTRRYVPQALMDMLRPVAYVPTEEGELRPVRQIDLMSPDEFASMFTPYIHFGGRRAIAGRLYTQEDHQPGVSQQIGTFKPNETSMPITSTPKRTLEKHQDGAITRKTGVDGRLLQVRVHREHDLVKKEKLDKKFNEAVQRVRELRRERMLLMRQMKRVRQDQNSAPCH